MFMQNFTDVLVICYISTIIYFSLFRTFQFIILNFTMTDTFQKTSSKPKGKYSSHNLWPCPETVSTGIAQRFSKILDFSGNFLCILLRQGYRCRCGLNEILYNLICMQGDAIPGLSTKCFREREGLSPCTSRSNVLKNKNKGAKFAMYYCGNLDSVLANILVVDFSKII